MRATTCNPGRFFATADAAQDGLGAHPDRIVLPVADTYPQLPSPSAASSSTSYFDLKKSGRGGA
ncbi:hypothetical protein [Mycobacterium intracellulare]|uniref:hypothetical protein n=1 Tax=Mycobacterium intracellulare TaxID=1767 RepID=UPI001FF9589A|nr:hypothetical protein [Mycobacterium intracellulare]